MPHLQYLYVFCRTLVPSQCAQSTSQPVDVLSSGSSPRPQGTSWVPGVMMHGEAWLLLLHGWLEKTPLLYHGLGT